MKKPYAFLLSLVMATQGFALSIAVAPLGDVVRDADLIVQGTVLDVSSKPIYARYDYHAWKAKIRINAVLKGSTTNTSQVVTWNAYRNKLFVPKAQGIWMFSAKPKSSPSEWTTPPNGVVSTNKIEEIRKLIVSSNKAIDSDKK